MASVSLRTSLLICGGLFALMTAMGIVGNVLQASGVVATGLWRYVIAGTFFLVFIAFGYSAIPVMVKLVLGAQVSIGNQDVPAVAAALRRENLMIYTMWGLITAGLVIAIPAAVWNGALGDGPTRAIKHMFVGPNLGILSARPDITVDEMTKASTVTIDVSHASAAISGSGVFEFRIPGTTLTFPGARYYYITTYREIPTRLRSINIGTSAEQAPPATIDAADADLRARLTADGWLTGHEVYRDERDRQLHRGATEGPEGRLWKKDGMVLDIERKRMDDTQPGDDPATAGQWIQLIDLWAEQEYPGIQRFVFQAPKAAR